MFKAEDFIGHKSEEKKQAGGEENGTRWVLGWACVYWSTIWKDGAAVGESAFCECGADNCSQFCGLAVPGHRFNARDGMQRIVEGLLCEEVRYPGEEYPCIHAPAWSKADGTSQHPAHFGNPWAYSPDYNRIFGGNYPCHVLLHEMAASVVGPQIKKPKDQPKKFLKIWIYTGLMARQMV